jgi:hypothetical protein
MLNRSLTRVIVVGLTLLGAAELAAQQVKGLITMSRVVRTVDVEDDTSKERTPGVEKRKIDENNVVYTTDENSAVVLVFSNGASISLGGNSELHIRSYLQDPFSGDYAPGKAKTEPEGAKSKTDLYLARGELVGKVNKLNPGSEFRVNTPAGAAGIRGTVFRVVYRPDSSGRAFFTVSTLEGNVEATSISGTTTDPVPVHDGQEVEIVIDVDETSGAVTVLTDLSTLVASDASPETMAVMGEAVAIVAEAAADVVMTAAADQVGGDEPTPDAGNASDGSGNSGGSDSTTGGDGDSDTTATDGGNNSSPTPTTPTTNPSPTQGKS